MKKKEKFPFQPFANAMRKARLDEGWTQEYVAEQLGIEQKYYQRLESCNNNIHPSLQVFFDLVHLYQLSVDEFLFPKISTQKSTARKRLDEKLDCLDDSELGIVEMTTKGIIRAKLNKT